MTNAREFTNADYDRMAALENASRLADLEIERTPLKDVGKLDIANMTAGEIVTLANVMEAVHVLTDALKRDAQAYAGYSPATSERRGSYGGGYEFSDEQKAAARQYLAQKFREYATTNDDRRPMPWEAEQSEPMVNTVAGPIKVSDIPRDANGQVVTSWLDENCTCDDHEQKRIEADRRKSTGDPEIAAGLYL